MSLITIMMMIIIIVILISIILIMLNIYAVQEAVHQVHVECTPEPRNVLSTTGSNKDTHRSEPRKSAECPSFSVSFRLTLSLTW